MTFTCFFLLFIINVTFRKFSITYMTHNSIEQYCSITYLCIFSGLLNNIILMVKYCANDLIASFYFSICQEHHMNRYSYNLIRININKTSLFAGKNYC